MFKWKYMHYAKLLIIKCNDRFKTYLLFYLIKKICMNIFKHFNSFNMFEIFIFNYFFHSPVELMEIKKKINSGEITKMSQLQINLLLISYNACMLNKSNSTIFAEITNFQSELLKNCQVCFILLCVFYVILNIKFTFYFYLVNTMYS